MSEPGRESSKILMNDVADWLMKQALLGSELRDVVRGCCDRIAATGFPLARVHLSFSVLHPLYSAVGFTWLRGTGLEVEGFRHTVTDENLDRFHASPYYYLVSKQLEYLRRPINEQSASEFPVFKDLLADGITDYLAVVSEFEIGTGQGMVGSWSTDIPGGFTDNELEALLRVQKRLAVAAKTAVQRGLASNMLTTYLGRNAGERVLSGQIKRGDGETIRAAIIWGDMRNSTSLAESLGRQGYIDCINTFFDNAAGAVADSGGEILSFIGDGFLAIFPSGTTKAERTKACRSALDAAMEAVLRMGEANSQRTSEGLDEIGFGIGLHMGNVMFGNVGLPDRLTFSVFGAAVNEVARLEGLNKTYKTSIIASSEFTLRCQVKWLELGTSKLRGVSHDMTVFTPDMTECTRLCKTIKRRIAAKPQLSDAENVVLLHRDETA